MMSHISRMCSRMSSGSPLSGAAWSSAGRPRSRARSSARSFAARRALDALLHLADAGQVFVELGLVGMADLAVWSAAACSWTRSRMLSVRRLPWLSKRLSNASDG